MTGGNGTGLGPIAPLLDIARAREVLAKVRTGRSTFGRAAVALGIPADRLASDREGRALAVYRAYVGRAVEVASPLALRACALNGVSLDGLALRLRPGTGWEHWLCGERPGDEWLADGSGRRAAVSDAAQREDWALQAWLHGGVYVGGGSRPFGVLGVRVLDAGLEMAATIGGRLLRTSGREGSIALGVELPATVAAAMPGRPLDALLGHPLLDGAGCIVTSIGEWRSQSGVEVRFALEPIPWSMPWAR